MYVNALKILVMLITISCSPHFANALERAANTSGGAAIAKGSAGKKSTVDPMSTGSVAVLPRPSSFVPPPTLVNWYAERGDIGFPRGSRLIYCHGYGCTFRTIVPLGAADNEKLAEIFATWGGSAAEERNGIDHAVQWWERRAAPLLGGPPDIRGSDFAHSHMQGQTDCLDEATNSTTILIYLQENGYLRYHRVLRPESRGGLFYAHATAVYEDITTKTPWIVDSWMRDAGDPNDVMPLAEWLMK